MQGTGHRIGAKGTAWVAALLAALLLFVVPAAQAQETAAVVGSVDGHVDLCHDQFEPVHASRRIPVFLESTTGSVEPDDIRIDVRLQETPGNISGLWVLLDTDHLHAEAGPTGDHTSYAGDAGLHVVLLSAPEGPCTPHHVVVEFEPEDGIITHGIPSSVQFTVSLGSLQDGNATDADPADATGEEAPAARLPGPGLPLLVASVAAGAAVWAHGRRRGGRGDDTG